MQQKLTFVFALLLLPLFSFAHGEEIMLPIFIQLVSLIIFAGLIISLKIGIQKKLILMGSYFLTLSLIILCTWDMPYLQNRMLIDLMLILGPAIITFVTYFVLRKININ
jgi:hypothetical protein